jgi:hypothetical protein
LALIFRENDKKNIFPDVVGKNGVRQSCSKFGNLHFRHSNYGHIAYVKARKGSKTVMTLIFRENDKKNIFSDVVGKNGVRQSCSKFGNLHFRHSNYGHIAYIKARKGQKTLIFKENDKKNIFPDVAQWTQTSFLIRKLLKR